MQDCGALVMTYRSRNANKAGYNYPFEIQIAGDTISPDSNNPFLFCPDLEFSTDIWIKLHDVNIEEVLEAYGYPFSLAENRMWTVEHMTGLRIEAFISQIINHPDECIELPSYTELLEMGYEF